MPGSGFEGFMLGAPGVESVPIFFCVVLASGFRLGRVERHPQEVA